jgi:spermidine/putrescine-binding protein
MIAIAHDSRIHVEGSTTMRSLTTRRTLLIRVGATGATVALAPLANMRLGALAQAADAVQMWGVGTVTLEDWSTFNEETGVDVTFTASPDVPGDIINQIMVQGASERYDILASDGGIEDVMGPEGHFLPIDTSKLTNWEGVPEALKSSPLISADGTLYGIPVVYNADSFGYYPEDLGGEVDTFKVLFDDERTMGKVALEDNWLTTLPMAATYLKGNDIAEIGNPSDMTEDEANGVVDFLIERKQAGQFRALWSGWEESIDLLARKEVIAENCWEPAVKELVNQGKDVQYAWTKEGYNKWLIGAWVLKGAEAHDNLDAVYKVLDGLLGGYYGAEIGLLRGYATGRPDLAIQYAQDHPDQFTAEDVTALEETQAKVEEKFAAEDFWQNANPTNRKAIEEAWQRFREA